MSALPVVTEEAAAVDVPLEPDLPWLHQQCMSVGLPRYHGHTSGAWSVCIDVPTDRPGCTAEVRSGYGHATLSEAMRAVLLNLGHQL